MHFDCTMSALGSPKHLHRNNFSGLWDIVERSGQIWIAHHGHPTISVCVKGALIIGPHFTAILIKRKFHKQMNFLNLTWQFLTYGLTIHQICQYSYDKKRFSNPIILLTITEIGVIAMACFVISLCSHQYLFGRKVPSKQPV